MKKTFLGLFLLLIVIFSIYKIYQRSNLLTVKPMNNDQQVNQTGLIKKPYNKIKSSWPEGAVLGNVLTVTEDSITVKELLSFQCFYSFDYTWDENNTLSEEEIDTKYNTEYLPWCTDPSGGSLYEETGKSLTYNFDDKTIFTAIVPNSDPIMQNVTKRIFMQNVEKYEPNQMMITLKLNGSIVTKIEEVYND